MASGDDESPLVVILVALAAYYIFRPSLENREDYKSGYSVGYDKGVAEARSKDCDGMDYLTYDFAQAIRNSGVCD